MSSHETYPKYFISYQNLVAFEKWVKVTVTLLFIESLRSDFTSRRVCKKLAGFDILYDSVK